jgi:hypothetical protein
MAYLGTTAASSVSNPPSMITQGVGGTPSFWSYKSTHTSTSLKTANFFTDAKVLGINQDDLMFAVNNASTTAPISYMGAFGAVTTSGAALSSAVSSTAA